MKKYILVSGVEYSSRGYGTKFLVYSKRRMKEIIRLNPRDDMQFIFFDFLSGRVCETKYTSQSKHQRVETEIAKYSRVSGKHYWNKTSKFKNGIRDTLSITNVYDYISEIGQNDPETLYELSFFSHSYRGGPILVNSYDDRNSKSKPSQDPAYSPALLEQDLRYTHMRDPDDKDGRYIDFSPIGDLDIPLFQKAFNSDGYSWVWGCAATNIIRDLITFVVKNKSYSGRYTPDDAEFIIKYNKYYKDIIMLFESYLKLSASKPLIVTFLEVKKLLLKILTTTYAYSLAYGSNKKVYATFVGVGANLVKGGLMISNPYRKMVVDFYTNHLNIGVDPSGRNYAEYLPTLKSTSINKTMASGIS